MWKQLVKGQQDAKRYDAKEKSIGHLRSRMYEEMSRQRTGTDDDDAQQRIEMLRLHQQEEQRGKTQVEEEPIELSITYLFLIIVTPEMGNAHNYQPYDKQEDNHLPNVQLTQVKRVFQMEKTTETAHHEFVLLTQDEPGNTEPVWSKQT